MRKTPKAHGNAFCCVPSCTFRGYVLLDTSRQSGKLEFVEGSQGIEQHCHSEPVRRLVWESPLNFGQLIVIQSVLTCRFPEFIHEK